MEWRFCGPIILAVVLFLLAGTIFERHIEAAIRRIIQHRQHLFETQSEECQPLQQTTEGTQHSCASSEKTLDNKSSFLASESTLNTYEGFPFSSSKKTLDCQSSCLVSEKYLDYNSSTVLSKPFPEIEI